MSKISDQNKLTSTWPFPTDPSFLLATPRNARNPAQEAIDLIHEAMESHGITIEEIRHFKKTSKDRHQFSKKDVIKDILLTMKDENLMFNDLIK